MKKILLLAIAIFFAGNLFAQQCCYVITNNNDTIHCVKLKIAAIGRAVKYKQNENDSYTTLTPGEVKEYQVSSDSSVWRAERLSGLQSHIFMRVVEDGRICLMENVQTYSSFNQYGGGYTSSSSTNWYISKDGAPATMLKSNTWVIIGASQSERRNELADMLADDPSVAADYQSTKKFSFENIRKLVKQYNQDMASKRQH